MQPAIFIWVLSNIPSPYSGTMQLAILCMDTITMQLGPLHWGIRQPCRLSIRYGTYYPSFWVPTMSCNLSIYVSCPVFQLPWLMAGLSNLPFLSSIIIHDIFILCIVTFLSCLHPYDSLTWPVLLFYVANSPSQLDCGLTLYIQIQNADLVHPTCKSDIAWIISTILATLSH